MSTVTAHCLYALAWLSFGAAHSLLAHGAVHVRFQAWLGPFTRVAYNLIAVVHLGLVWVLGRVLLDGGGLLAPTVVGSMVGTAVGIMGWVIVIVALRGYDLGRFAGVRQIRDHFRGIEEPEDEPLRLDGLHRYVRHPLYTGAFLILWGNVGSAFELATAVWASLYLIIGTHYEERKLLRLFGDAYRDYRAKVPAYFPWRGCAI